MKGVIFSQEELQEKLEVWQKRLRLQDWIVKAVIVRGRDMKLEGCEAEVSWTLTNKTATIRMLNILAIFFRKFIDGEKKKYQS